MVLSLSGCGIIRCKLCSLDDEGSQKVTRSVTRVKVDDAVLWQESVDRSQPVIITVTGFGAPDGQIQNKPQQVLMAMRASEVDAYRTLAERVHGVELSATTKVSDFITNYDHLRAVTDTYIQRARIVSQGLTKEGYYETTLSLTLDESFFYRFRSASVAAAQFPSAGVTVAEVRRPMGTLSTHASHYDVGNGQGWLRSE